MATWRGGAGQAGTSRSGTISPKQFQQILRDSLNDRRLTGSERTALAAVLRDAASDEQQRGVLRHLAFDLARRELGEGPAQQVLHWLEEINKLLAPADDRAGESVAEAYFSPGDECTQQIVGLLRNATRTADLCVFTITDDRISAAIEAAHARRVGVRIITDNEKSLDLGSDIERLRRLGIPLRLDKTPDHMHHKFAVFDAAVVVTGSFNWTRSASGRNHENLIVTSEPRLVGAFHKEFERLWQTL